MRSLAISGSVFASVLLLAAACERAPAARFDQPVQPEDPVIDVQLGAAVAADGTVPENVRRDDFRAGEPIFIAASFRGLVGQPVTVHWIAPGELPAGSNTATVRSNGTIHFAKTDTQAWIPGDYRVTLSAGSRTLVSEQFHILGSEAAVLPRQ